MIYFLMPIALSLNRLMIDKFPENLFLHSWNLSLNMSGRFLPSSIPDPS
jgi:hypothetical protein